VTGVRRLQTFRSPTATSTPGGHRRRDREWTRDELFGRLDAFYHDIGHANIVGLGGAHEGFTAKRR
jgi:hypothetical protein